MSEERIRQRPWSRKPVLALPEDAGFTKAEHWAWARILNGKVADMSRYPGDDISPADESWLLGVHKPTPNPKDPDSFTPDHRLSELFLRTVLFHEPWASAPELPGVRVKHARIEGKIYWSGRKTTGGLWMDSCRFEAVVILQDLIVSGLLSLEGAYLENGLNADRAKVAGNLVCSGGFTSKGDVRLAAANIGGQANFQGATLKNRLIGDGIQVAGDLFCINGFSAAGEVRLPGARIGGQAAFIDAVLERGLNASRMHVTESLFCRDRFTAKGDIILVGADIGGALQLAKSRIESEIDLTGAKIGAELYLDSGGNSKPDWGPGASLILRNARIRALAASLEGFCKTRTGKKIKRGDFPRLDFTGLRYEELGGYDTSGVGSLAHSEVRDLKILLAAASEHEGNFTPGPYRQMALVLAESGQKSKSVDLLHAMRKHERKASKGARGLGLALSGRLTGFGYRPWYAGYWFLFLTAIWTALGLALTGETALRTPNIPDLERTVRWIWFTVGNALPLIVLDDAHKTFLADALGKEPHDVPSGIASLFYFHKLLGYSLITYLAASLTGLTDKRS